MLWFLPLTQRCNLHCRYCGNSDSYDIEDAPHPIEITYDIEKAWTILATSDPAPVVCFYGGEPLLKMHLIKQAIDLFRKHNPTCKFVLQTNGTYLNNLKDEILHNIGTILVSIDGVPELNDSFRGEGTYDRVMANIEGIRNRGYKGDLIARMTVTQSSDIYREVMHLVSTELFDHVHWQLDALFDAPFHADFDEWRESNYNPGLRRLATTFREWLKEGRVLPLVPFLGLLRDYQKANDNGTAVANEKEVRRELTELRCGSGVNAFTLTTAGQIFACPIAPVFDGCVIQDEIVDSGVDVVKLPSQCTAHIAGPCLKCDIRHVCGGRCLVANKTMLWGGDGFESVCDTIRCLVTETQLLFADVSEAINSKKIKVEDIMYPPFNNSTEIIP